MPLDWSTTPLTYPPAPSPTDWLGPVPVLPPPPCSEHQWNNRPTCVRCYNHSRFYRGRQMG
eukprot:10893717-Heterocapsa_arctica.AAC.1